MPSRRYAASEKALYRSRDGGGRLRAGAAARPRMRRRVAAIAGERMGGPWPSLGAAEAEAQAVSGQSLIPRQASLAINCSAASLGMA